MNKPDFTPLKDHLLVYSEPGVTDRTESGVYIPDWQRGDKDPTKAEVLAVPTGLSSTRRLDYCGMDGQDYHYSDLRDLPRVGETVYLRPNTFKPELEYPGYPGVFLIALDRVVAIDSEQRSEHQFWWNGAKGPTPFQGLLLCEEVYDEDVVLKSNGAHERVSKSGLVTDTEMFTLPIPFTLRVLYSGIPLHGQENVVKPGDVIAAHRMLFAYHRVVQDDVIDGTTPERMMWQCGGIVIEGKEYKIIPRQMVMSKVVA